MEIRVLIVCSVCSVIIVDLLPSVDCLKCTGNTYYPVKKSGKETCRQCKPCIGGGIGWNEKNQVERQEDERGFLECRPCKRCAAGTYRKLESRDSWCRRCTLNCTRLHRYSSVNCGGDNEGHCSECLHGYTTASKELNSMCTRSEAESTNDPRTKATTYSSKLHVQPTETPWSNCATDDSDQQGTSNLHTNLVVWILGSLLVAVVLVGVLVVAVRKNRTSTGTDLAKEVDSKHALIASNGTNVCGNNDLEMDGGGNQPNYVRGERPVLISIDEKEGIRRDIIQTKVVNRKYRNRPLHIDDYTLTMVALKVSGERRHELFHTYLKLEKAKTDPEQERWLHGIISFPDYILNVLKIWLQINGDVADLQRLVGSLKMASFTDVIVGILDLPENQIASEDNMKGIETAEIEFESHTDNDVAIPEFPEEEENINETVDLVAQQDMYTLQDSHTLTAEGS